MFVKFSAQAQGKSHIEKNIPCQDAAHALLILNNTFGMAFVADGHGGAKYLRSQTGSGLAIKIAEKSLSDFNGKIAREKAAFYNKEAVSGEQKKQKIIDFLKRLEGNIIYQWRNAVIDDLKGNPLTEAEKNSCIANKIDIDDPLNLVVLYGTTLLAAVMSESFWFVLQIGDGLCVVLDNEGNAGLPIEEDERLAFGRTSSLCDSNAIDNFRESYGFEPIKGITVATDGVVDSFIPEKYLLYNKKLMRDFTQIPEKAETELNAFLPELSEHGSGDDVAIAGIFRAEKQK